MISPGSLTWPSTANSSSVAAGSADPAAAGGAAARAGRAAVAGRGAGGGLSASSSSSNEPSSSSSTTTTSQSDNLARSPRKARICASIGATPPPLAPGTGLVCFAVPTFADLGVLGSKSASAPLLLFRFGVGVWSGAAAENWRSPAEFPTSTLGVEFGNLNPARLPALRPSQFSAGRDTAEETKMDCLENEINCKQSH